MIRVVFFLCLVGTGLIVCPPSAHAARFSGAYLLQVCSGDEKGRELVKGGHIACQAYIAGVLDYHNLIRSLGTAPSVDFCVPEGVGLTDLQKIVTMYISKHKEEHDKFIAAPAIALALFDVYPCKGH